MAAGLANKEIAHQLEISEATVKSHIGQAKQAPRLQQPRRTRRLVRQDGARSRRAAIVEYDERMAGGERVVGGAAMREPDEALDRLCEIVQRTIQRTKVWRIPDPSRGRLRLPSAAGRSETALNTPKIISASDQGIR